MESFFAIFKIIWQLMILFWPAFIVLGLAITIRVWQYKRDKKRRQKEMDYLAERIAEEQRKNQIEN